MKRELWRTTSGYRARTLGQRTYLFDPLSRTGQTAHRRSTVTSDFDLSRLRSEPMSIYIATNPADIERLTAFSLLVPQQIRFSFFDEE